MGRLLHIGLVGIYATLIVGAALSYHHVARTQIAMIIHSEIKEK